MNKPILYSHASYAEIKEIEVDRAVQSWRPNPE